MLLKIISGITVVAIIGAEVFTDGYYGISELTNRAPSKKSHCLKNGSKYKMGIRGT